jgi:hypothetical protein
MQKVYDLPTKYACLKFRGYAGIETSAHTILQQFFRERFNPSRPKT